MKNSCTCSLTNMSSFAPTSCNGAIPRIHSVLSGATSRGAFTREMATAILFPCASIVTTDFGNYPIRAVIKCLRRYC
jgi:hypothetical protein